MTSMLRVAVAVAVALLATPVALAAKPLPDLVVKKLSLPDHAIGGSTITVRDTVANRGTASARGSTTAFYLSFDGKLDDNDIKLKEQRTVGRITRGKFSAGATKVVVPAYLTGLFDVIACADDASKVKESNEKNNCRTARTPLTIELPPQG